MRCFVVHFGWKSCYFVHRTTAKQILFLNHRNRKGVGDKHNVLVHYVDVNATDPASVALWNSLKWDILWFISDQKSYCCLCACYNSVMDFISQPQEQKVGRRQTQCSSTLCGCLCNWPSWHCPLQPFQMRYYVVHFDWKSCFFSCHKSEMHLFYSSTTWAGKL